MKVNISNHKIEYNTSYPIAGASASLVPLITIKEFMVLLHLLLNNL